MALYQKIANRELNLHAFQAAVSEVMRGKMTAATAQTFFGLTVSERNEVTTLVNRVQGGQLTAKEVDDVFLLADGGFPGYTTESELKTRLGV